MNIKQGKRPKTTQYPHSRLFFFSFLFKSFYIVLNPSNVNLVFCLHHDFLFHVCYVVKLSGRHYDCPSLNLEYFLLQHISIAYFLVCSGIQFLCILYKEVKLSFNSVQRSICTATLSHGLFFSDPKMFKRESIRGITVCAY